MNRSQLPVGNRCWILFPQIEFPRTNDIQFDFTSICIVKIRVLFMFFVIIYIIHWCPTRFPYQLMFVSLAATRQV